MHAVIMAGGKGTRFWPAGREKKPKQLLKMAGERTLLQQAVDRILPLVPRENILVVTGEAHGRDTLSQLPELPAGNIIMEPMGRNTAPCIGLASMAIGIKDPEAVMIVLPADHVVEDDEAFRDTLRLAALAAEDEPCLVTIGIPPRSPETGFGYIERGEPASAKSRNDVFRVLSFREKPDLETARSFLEKGTFFWNSGIFVWKVSSIMKSIRKYLPDLYEELLSLECSLGTPEEAGAIRAAYERILPISIDYGVMEKARDVLVVKGDFGWNDLGSWDALADLLPKDDAGNILRGPVLAVDTQNSLVLSGGKVIALVGVDDLAVVETEDAILVLKRGRSQDVKKVVDRLERENKKEYL
ncbi:MAG: mannose-1-phosphate guanylyltransferase [Syntrophales bacterium]|nr:mannose-1-phosphate guanylyltransferase [Syntrophales bacterium]